MCLIVAKPRAGRWDLDLLRAAAINNPHGAGLSWAAAGSLYTVRKMTFEQLEPALETAARYPAVLHLRYATHGEMTVANVHPFYVAGRKDLLFAHNGIINSLPRHKELSDTRLFNRDVLSKLPDRFEESSKFLQAMASATSSRFAFLRRDGRWFLAGAYHVKQGCHYSNYSYVTYTPTGVEPSGYDSCYVDETSGQLRFAETVEGRSVTWRR